MKKKDEGRYSEVVNTVLSGIQVQSFWISREKLIYRLRSVESAYNMLIGSYQQHIFQVIRYLNDSHDQRHNIYYYKIADTANNQPKYKCPLRFSIFDKPEATYGLEARVSFSKLISKRIVLELVFLFWKFPKTINSGVSASMAS